MALNLFQLAKKNTVIANPDAAKLCPELGKLKPDQFLFVVLMKDYASPYHQLPDHERLLRSKRHVYKGADVSPEEDKAVIAAMELYVSLQYDPRREQLAIYRRKVMAFTKQIGDSDNPREIDALDKAIDTMNNRIEKMEKEINDAAAQDDELKGGQRLSHVERWGKNKREYLLLAQQEAGV